MKAFFRKHRFKMVLIVLILILIYVSFYMLWVHVPYTSKQNELTRIQEEICQENDYSYDDYFNEYNSSETYYIVKIKEKKKTKYVVFNEKKKEVKSYSGKVVKRSDVKNSFLEKYDVEATKIEIAYENDRIVYCLTYQGKDSLIYAFYGIDDGEFIKAYRL